MGRSKPGSPQRPKADQQPPANARRVAWCGLAALVLVVAACLPYLNSLQNAFHFDDNSEIVENENIRSLDGLVAARPLGRWLLFGTFYLNYRIHGLGFLPGWHVVNILLHAGCVIALWRTLEELQSGGPPGNRCGKPPAKRLAAAPFCGALLLAVHPLASEPVNYIQARCVLLYTLSALLALCCAIRFGRLGSTGGKICCGGAMLVVVLLASLSKQVGVYYALSLPALYWLVFRLPEIRPVRRRFVLLGAAAGGVALAVGVWLVHSGAWAAMRERLEGDFGDYFWAQTIVFWRYIGLAFCPLPGRLNVDHAVACRPYSPMDGDVLLATLALVVVVLVPAVYLARKKPVIGLLWMMVPVGLLPYFVMPSAEAMVEYRFYLPLAALCGLVGIAAAGLIDRFRTAGIAVLAAIVVALGIATAARNTVWRTDLSLWSDAQLKSPRKARTVNGLAWALLTDKEQGDRRHGLELAKQSLDPACVDLPPGFNPYMVDTLAEAYFLNGDLQTAIRIEQDLIEQGVGDVSYFQRQLDRYQAGTGMGDKR